MIEDNKDVDLYAELRKTLDTAKESEEEETSGASAEEPTGDIETPEINHNDDTELSEDEISKLSPRAQKRIRDLADKVKELAEKPEEVIPEEEIDKEETIPHNFKDVKEFLSAVQDEDSRKLLENFYNVIKGETSSILAPIEAKNNETKFETEFSKYEKIEGVSNYKNDLKKTFLRNPNQSIEALVGKVVTDLALHKIKPIEAKPSTPSRGKVDTSNLSKDELYDMLDTLKG